MSSTKDSNLRLQQQVQDVTNERDTLAKASKQMENSLLQSIATKNGEISSLKMNLEDLETDLQYKNEKLEQYETSYRALAKLSVQLTRERLRKSRSKLVNLVRRRRRRKNENKNGMNGSDRERP